jgi:energy-coupling factor transporter transmembrane protein EcfT
MAVEFVKGESTLHGLDARTKLLLFAGLTVLSVIILDPVIIAILFITLYLLGRSAVEPKLLNSNLRVLVVIFLTFSMFQIFFFTPSDARFLFYLVPGPNWIPVTVQGIVRGVAVFFRFFIVVLAVHLMLYTTPPVELVLALTKQERQPLNLQEIGITMILGVILFAMAVLAASDQVARIPLDVIPRLGVVAGAAIIAGFGLHRLASAGLPPEMGVALSLGFATVGILSQQTEKITDAQKARGYDVKPKNIIRRMQVLTALLLPIFLATLERSQDIAVAILARAFDYNISKRTYRRELAFHRNDYIVIGVIVVLLIGGLALNYLGIGNPTEQFVLWLVGSVN